MSQEPELPEDEAQAAEYALGLLTGVDKALLDARLAQDSDFAAQVEAWRERFAPLADEAAPQAPPADVWRAIDRRLPANDDGAAAGERVRFWRRATAGSLALAAASIAAVLVLLINRPAVPDDPMAPPVMLNASLAGENSTPLFVAFYDPARQAMVVTSLVPGGTDPAHAHELWLLPPGASPRALEIIEPGTARALPMSPDVVQMIAEGAQLAVSVEPPGGSPDKTAPSGPIAASGKLKPI